MQLPFGVGYLVPSAILGAEELSSQALQVRGEVLHFTDTILRLTMLFVLLWLPEVLHFIKDHNWLQNHTILHVKKISRSNVNSVSVSDETRYI